MENKIAQVRYSLKDALESVPKKGYFKARKDLMEILNIKHRNTLRRYENGAAMPALDKAKAIEEYFLNTWGITDVWKEIAVRELVK